MGDACQLALPVLLFALKIGFAWREARLLCCWAGCPPLHACTVFCQEEREDDEFVS